MTRTSFRILVCHSQNKDKDDILGRKNNFPSFALIPDFVWPTGARAGPNLNNATSLPHEFSNRQSDCADKNDYILQRISVFGEKNGFQDQAHVSSLIAWKR